MITANITMPKLGAAMVEGVLLRWHVGVGDRFQTGDILAEIEADKANMEIEAEFNGIVAKLCVNPGDIVPVDGLLALVQKEDKADGQRG